MGAAGFLRSRDWEKHDNKLNSKKRHTTENKLENWKLNTEKHDWDVGFTMSSLSTDLQANWTPPLQIFPLWQIYCLWELARCHFFTKIIISLVNYLTVCAKTGAHSTWMWVQVWLLSVSSLILNRLFLQQSCPETTTQVFKGSVVLFLEKIMGVEMKNPTTAKIRQHFQLSVEVLVLRSLMSRVQLFSQMSWELWSPWFTHYTWRQVHGKGQPFRESEQTT